MKSNKYDERQRYILALKERLDELYAIKRTAVWVPVKPYQDGWIIGFVLRQDALGRKDAPAMLEALKVAGTPYETKDLKKISRVRQLKSWNKCHSIFMVKRKYNLFSANKKLNEEYYAGPTLHTLDPKRYEALSLAAKSFFYKVTEVSIWGGRTYDRYYHSVPSYYIELRVTKRIVTHHGGVDPEIVSELKWIDAKLDQLQAWGRSYPMYPNKGAVRTSVRTNTRRFLKGEVDDIVPKTIKECDW